MSSSQRSERGRSVEAQVIKAKLAARLLGANGRVRLGRFELDRCLGRGGMGVVYAAYDPRRQARVALKTVYSGNPRYLYCLKREFRALAEFRHPNVVSYHELHEIDGAWFFTMDLVEGQAFTEYVRPHGRLDERRLRSTSAQLAQGLAAIHGSGRLHCDLKPSNVMVTARGEVRIMDFGLMTDRSGTPGRDAAGAGTPTYMAPEQACGRQSVEATDWYAFGAMLFKGLTGRHPFSGSSDEVLLAKRSRSAPAPSAVAKGVPADLETLCTRLLSRDLTQRPCADEVLNLLQPRALPTPPIEDRGPAPFLGRELHLRAMARRFEEVARGKPRVLWLVGEPGMGKTALLDRFSQTICDHAMLLRGRCSEREQVTYKALDGVVDALARTLSELRQDEAAHLVPRNVHALVRLFPVLRRVEVFDQAASSQKSSADSVTLRNQAFGAFRELARRLCERQPVVIAVDDLQWADLDSARLLAHLLNSGEAPALLFVGAYRAQSHNRTAFLRYLRTEQRLEDEEQLEVGALSPAEARELAASLLGPKAGPNIDAVVTEAEGIPLFLTVLADHMRGKGSRATAGNLRLHDVLEEWIRELGAPAGRLLDVVSVAARPLWWPLAFQAAELDVSEYDVISNLRALRLVRSGGDHDSHAIETYHDRIREAVVARLDADRLREVHRALALAIEAHGGGDPEVLLAHHRGAGQARPAYEAAVRAGQQAMAALAFDRAAELFQVAIDLACELGCPAETIGERQGDLGEALAYAGRAKLAAKAFLEAAERCPDTDRYRLRAAQQYLRSGQTSKGLSLARSMLAEVGETLPKSDQRAQLSYVWSMLRAALTSRLALRAGPPREAQRVGTALLAALFQEMSVAAPMRGAALHARFFERALRSRDTRWQAQAYAWHAFHLTRLGGTRELAAARRAIERLAAIRAQSDDPYVEGLMYLAQGTEGFYSGRFTEALAETQTAERIFADHGVGSYWERCWLFTYRLLCREFVGGEAALEQELRERSRELVGREERFPAAMLAMARGLVSLNRDRPEDCLAALHDGLEEGPFDTFRYFVFHRAVDGLLYLGHGAEALELVEQTWPTMVRSDLYRARAIRAVVHCIRARAAVSAFAETGAKRAADLTLRGVEELLRLRWGFVGYAHGIHGTLLHLEGRRREAVEALERALLSMGSDANCRLYASYRLAEISGVGLQEASEAQRAEGMVRPDRVTAFQLGSLTGPLDTSPLGSRHHALEE